MCPFLLFALPTLVGRYILSAFFYLLSVFCIIMSKIVIQLIVDSAYLIVKLSFGNYQLLTDEVENNGFEPLTPCVQSRCSSQLS